MNPVGAKPGDPEDALIRIGELSRRTGVSADALRAWERRYGLLAPAHSPGGFRLYSPADEAVVRRMCSLIEQGLSPAEAARHATAPPSEPVQPTPALSPEGSCQRILRAIDAYDEDGINATLDEAISVLTVDALAQGIVLPVLRELGDRWQRGQMSVAQEHFASNVIRARLLNLGRGWGTGRGPRMLLACVPGEHHDFGLIAFGLVLNRRGMRVTFLGPDTPIESVGRAIRELEPRMMVLASLFDERFEAAEEELASLDREGTTLAVAGSGASEELAQRLHATYLSGGPVEEAVRLGSEPLLSGAPDH